MAGVARSLLMQLRADTNEYNSRMAQATGSARLLSRETELYALKNNAARNSIDVLTNRFQNQQKIQDTLNTRIEATKNHIQNLARVYGEADPHVAKFQQRLLDLQIAQEKLNSTRFNITSSAIGNINSRNVIGDVAKNAAGYVVGNALYNGAQTLGRNTVMDGLAFNNSIQQASISFTTLTGSAAKANEAVANLWEMAKKTPFQFPDLLDTTKKLLAFKFDLKDIPGMLTTIGDASSGLGLGAEGLNRISLALGQMSAKGKVSGDEMKQMTDAGINAWSYLATATGKSTAEIMKLSEKGLLPAKESIKVILQGMQKDFGGLMDKQSQSYDGLMSTLKDASNEAFGTVMRPAFDWLTKEALPMAIQKLNDFTEGFKSGGWKGGINALLGDDNGKAIISVLDEITSLGSSASGVLSGVAGPIGNIARALLEWKPLIPIILGVVSGMSAMSVANSAAPAISTLTGAINKFRETMATGGTTTQAFKKALESIISPGGLIALGIGVVVGAATAYISYKQAQEQATKATLDAALAASESYKKNKDLIDRYIDLKEKTKDSKEKTEELKQVTQELTNAIPNATEVIQKQTMALRDQKLALEELIRTQTRGQLEAGYHSALGTIDDARKKLRDAQTEENKQQINLFMGNLNGESQANINKYEAALGAAQNAKINAQAELDKKQAAIDAYNKFIEDDKIFKPNFSGGGGVPTSEIQKKMDDLAKSAKETAKAGGAAGDDLNKAIAGMSANGTKELNKFNQAFKNFFNQLNSMRDSIMSFGNMFEKVTYEKFSPEKIRFRLQQVLKEMENWRTNLAKLASRGVDEYTLNDLRSLGLAGAGVVKGFAGMSDAQLQETLGIVNAIGKNTSSEALKGTYFKVSHELNGKIDVSGINSKDELVAVDQLIGDEVRLGDNASDSVIKIKRYK